MAEGPPHFSALVPLAAKHELDGFQSGEPVLDIWLRQRALENAALGASQTYVMCLRDSNRVAGFYALCMGQILNRDATGAMRRNMPRHIPAVILGRLAIDRTWQGQGLGRELLLDAVQRSDRAASEISARLLVVHAISSAAESFYLHYGFVRLPVETPTLALDLTKFRDHREE